MAGPFFTRTVCKGPWSQVKGSWRPPASFCSASMPDGGQLPKPMPGSSLLTFRLLSGYLKLAGTNVGTSIIGLQFVVSPDVSWTKEMDGPCHGKEYCVHRRWSFSVRKLECPWVVSWPITVNLQSVSDYRYITDLSLEYRVEWTLNGCIVRDLLRLFLTYACNRGHMGLGDDFDSFRTESRTFFLCNQGIFLMGIQPRK